jgi:hypothetical protein
MCQICRPFRLELTAPSDTSAAHESFDAKERRAQATAAAACLFTMTLIQNDIAVAAAATPLADVFAEMTLIAEGTDTAAWAELEAGTPAADATREDIIEFFREVRLLQTSLGGSQYIVEISVKDLLGPLMKRYRFVPRAESAAA